MEEIKNSRENPHQCGQCNQTFHYENNLISHIENVHLMDDIKNCANFQIYLDLAKENKLSWDLLEKFKNAAQKCSNLDESKELNDLLFQELKTSRKRETDLKSKMENANRIYSIKIQLMEKICEEKIQMLKKDTCQSTGNENKKRKCHFDGKNVILPNKKKDGALVVDLEDEEVDFPQKIIVEPKPEKEEEETKNESEIQTRIYVDDLSFLDHETEFHYSSPNSPMQLEDEENDFQKKNSDTVKDGPRDLKNVSVEIAQNVQEILVYHTKKESVEKSKEKSSPKNTETDSTDGETAKKIPFNAWDGVKDVKGILVHKR